MTSGDDQGEPQRPNLLQRLGGHSVGMGSVLCVSAISVMTSHCTGATMRVVGKMGSGERG